MEKVPDCSDSTYKYSSLLFLRAQDKVHKKHIKRQSQLIKRRKYLGQLIENNSNIFQMLSSNFNRRSAQNMIWLKNYKMKMKINILREDNNSLKAKLWNVEKQNRRMDKQIQNWNLEKVFKSSNNKPYIDMVTVIKVFEDQDFQIVSTKIDITKYEELLTQKEEEIKKLSLKSTEFSKHLSHLKHMTCQAKVSLLLALSQDKQSQNSSFGQCRDNPQAIQSQRVMNQEVRKNNEKIDQIIKHIQVKKKRNQQYLTDIEAIQKQITATTKINESEIDKLKQEMRKIKLEQKNSLKDFRKDVRNLRKNCVTLQCEIQDLMGAFIEQKIFMNLQIQRLKEAIMLETLNDDICTHRNLQQLLASIDN